MTSHRGVIKRCDKRCDPGNSPVTNSDQQIGLCCDLNLILDCESVDLPREVDQWIQIHWITQNSL